MFKWLGLFPIFENGFLFINISLWNLSIGLVSESFDVIAIGSKVGLFIYF
jgi:hypothetical protein